MASVVQKYMAYGIVYGLSQPESLFFGFLI